MRWIKIKPQTLSPPHRIQRPLGGHNIKCDLRRMNLKRELNTHFIKNIQNRIPSSGEIQIPLFPLPR